MLAAMAATALPQHACCPNNVTLWHASQPHASSSTACVRGPAWQGAWGQVCSLRAAKANSGLQKSYRSKRVYALGQEGESCSNAGDEEDDGVKSQVDQADWRAFRARLVRGTFSTEALTEQEKEQELWAHPIVAPEAGCLLLAHPNAFSTRQQYFHRVVIFLFAHSDAGSAGVILNSINTDETGHVIDQKLGDFTSPRNDSQPLLAQSRLLRRPTEYSLGQLAGFEDMMPELASCPLYLGGDVGPDCTQVIHGVSGLEDSREIMNGVYMGGAAAIQQSVKSGQSNPSDYRWFLRYAGWGPGQLQQEVAAGVWYLSSCSKKFVLKQCIKLPKPLWREVLEHMGPPYLDISKRAYGES